MKKQTGKTRTMQELLAEIRENPRDDAPRIVYADMLVEAGDPRGTFIQMQLARSGRTPTAAERKEELKVLRKHYRGWLGEIAGCVGGLGAHNFSVGPERTGMQIRFDRGFLTGVFVAQTPRKIAPAIGSAELATVEELTLRDEGERVLRETALPALRFLTIPITLLEIAHERFAKQLEALEMETESSVASRTNIARCAKMPALRELTLLPQGSKFDEATSAVVGAGAKLPQLTKLVVSYNNATVTFERAGKRWRVAEGDTKQAGARKIVEAVGA